MNQSDHSRGVTLVRTVILPVSQTPRYPSFTMSIPAVLPPVSSSFCFLFLFHPSPPSVPGSLATQPHPQHEKNMILTALPETLLYCLSTHTHTRTRYTPTFLSAPPTPPDLLLILPSLQRCCQAVMFFLASPTQFSHSFPLPQRTAASHTPWAQLTH